jgi:hypothetical protein
MEKRDVDWRWGIFPEGDQYFPYSTLTSSKYSPAFFITFPLPNNTQDFLTYFFIANSLGNFKVVFYMMVEKIYTCTCTSP